MHFTRREFFPFLGVVAAPMAPVLQPEALPKFVDRLPIPPLAQPAGSKEFRGQSVPLYRIGMREMRVKVHRDLPPTRVWSYGASWPGPAIETRSGKPIAVEWSNELPSRHFLPIDHNLHGAEKSVPEVRGVVHVHGARVPPGSDGFPENWYVPGQSVTNYYPNQQEATALWYHDHAMGITRLNTYAGMFGLYVIRDEVEDALDLPKGKYEIPLIIADRSFTHDGQLFYPVSGRKDAPWTPEVFGNTMLVNGTIAPYLDVEPRRYRFRVLNASNARFYRLALEGGQTFSVIGSDQGLLNAPATVKRLSLAPGERADLIVDFSASPLPEFVLRDDAFVLMQFRVAGRKSDSKPLPAKLRDVPRTPETSAIKTRMLTLGEIDNKVAEPMQMLLTGKHWHDPVSETPAIDTTEIWSLVNLTDDTHPIHLHLVRFQILDRRRFDPFLYQTRGELKYIGDAIPPAAAEAGWKDTVRADSRLITRIIVRFEGYTGRYVWHCHIAEHEDNDMMRPYDVIRG